MTFQEIKAAVIAAFRDITGRPAHWVGGQSGQMFKQADGTTDLSRILGALAIVCYLAYEGYAVLGLHQQLDPGALGEGMFKVCAGVGILILGHNFANQ